MKYFRSLSFHIFLFSTPIHFWDVVCLFCWWNICLRLLLFLFPWTNWISENNEVDFAFNGVPNDDEKSSLLSATIIYSSLQSNNWPSISLAHSQKNVCMLNRVTNRQCVRFFSLHTKNDRPYVGYWWERKTCYKPIPMVDPCCSVVQRSKSTEFDVLFRMTGAFFCSARCIICTNEKLFPEYFRFHNFNFRLLLVCCSMLKFSQTDWQRMKKEKEWTRKYTHNIFVPHTRAMKPLELTKLWINLSGLIAQ